MKFQETFQKKSNYVKGQVTNTEITTEKSTKTRVFQNKSTQVRFLQEVQNPKVSKMTRRQLATHLDKSTYELDRYLRGCGITFTALSWGGTNAQRNKQLLVDKFNEGFDPRKVTRVALDLGITKSWSAIQSMIDRANGTYAPVPNDIEPGNHLRHRHHDRETADLTLGGTCLRDQTPGMIVPARVNYRISYIASALNFRESQVRFLYESVLEDKRPRWIIAHHYDLYGRRSFKSILKRFFPTLSKKDYTRLTVSVS